MSETPSGGGNGGTSFLAIFFGVFAAFGFVGIVGVFVMGWVMEKSFSSVVDLILSDTGWMAAEAYPEDLPEPDEEPAAWDDEVAVDE